MKITSLPKLALTLTLALAWLTSANADTIVYQDTFDDGVLATNPGIGGGFSQEITGGAGFVESSGSIDADTGANNDRGFGFSTNTFDVSDGFILEFTANASFLGNNSANRFSVGLAAAGSDFATFSLSGRNFLGDNRAAIEGVGVDFTTDQGQGLSYNDGFGNPSVPPDPTGTVTVLSNAQTITASTDLAVSLTVAADGSYSYSINGAPATTGAAFGLDLSQEYHFATYFQDDLGDFAIRDVTLTALAPVVIPEPSSIALIGLGALGFFSRRRR